MKINLSLKQTRGATRVLNAFATGLFNLLLKKPFSEITVNEICEQSAYPRATFYNYFDDKYDLLNYFWLNLAKDIWLDNFEEIPPEELILFFYNQIFDLCKKYEDEIKKMFKNNPFDSYFFASFRTYMKLQIKEIFNFVPLNSKNPVPKELMIEHYCNTILLLLEWHFSSDNMLTKEQAKKYIEYLLLNL